MDRTSSAPLDNPIKKDSHLVILYGNLAPEGAVAKITGKEGLVFTGTAKVFDCEEQALHSHPERRHRQRRCHRHPLRRPERRPRHARNAVPDFRGHGQRPGQGRGLDHRRPFLRRHPWLRGRPHHPGSSRRRRLGIVQDGDDITIDAETKQLTLHVNEHEIARRFEKWQQPAPRYTRGVLAKYAKLVSSASLGAVTDKLD